MKKRILLILTGVISVLSLSAGNNPLNYDDLADNCRLVQEKYKQIADLKQVLAELKEQLALEQRQSTLVAGGDYSTHSEDKPHDPKVSEDTRNEDSGSVSGTETPIEQPTPDTQKVEPKKTGSDPDRLLRNFGK